MSDQKAALVRLTEKLLDSKSPLNLDGLLDSVAALVNDCDHPVLRRIKNIESFLQRCRILKMLK